MAPRFSPSTTRSNKLPFSPRLRAFRCCGRSFTAHSSKPVATIAQPIRPLRKNSQRSGALAKRAVCRPSITL